MCYAFQSMCKYKCKGGVCCLGVWAGQVVKVVKVVKMVKVVKVVKVVKMVKVVKVALMR